MLSNIFNRISFWALFATIVLLPIFFVPFTHIPVDTSKGLILVIGLVISVIFWTAGRLSDGRIVIPRSPVLVAGLGVALAFFISALFSPAMKTSFFGIMLDTGTFWFMLGAFVLMMISAITVRNANKAKILIYGTLLASAILLIVQTLHLFIPKMTLGVLGNPVINLFGSWNSLGMFAGFSAIIAIFAIEFFELKKNMKWVLFGLTILSLFMVAVVNFTIAWMIVGAFALFIFIYKISFSLSSQSNSAEKKVTVPVFTFAVVMIALLFLTSNSLIGGFLPNRLGAPNLEIRPSLATTLSIAKATLAHHPIVGAGPNRFSNVWDLYKSSAINGTYFWNSSFDFGFSTLPTFAVTTGGLGILAWLALIVLFAVRGIKYLFNSQIVNKFDPYAGAFFMAALYLLVVLMFYSAGPAILLLCFAFMGGFIGLNASNSDNYKGDISFYFLDEPRKTFLSIIVLVAIMLVSASVLFKYVSRFASIPYLQKTVSAQKIEDAERNIANAVSLDQNDLYLRTFSQVYIAKFNSFISSNNSKDSLSDADKANLQSILSQAVSGAQMAVSYDATNYLNYQALGAVYDLVVSKDTANSADKALDAYKKASELNPQNPILKLSLARTSFLAGDMKNAKDYANQTLALKQDYADAYILLSQVAKNEGDNAKALSYAQTASSIYPQDKDLMNYVDSLKQISYPAEPAPAQTVLPKKKN